MSQLNTSFWENGAARQLDQMAFEADAESAWDEQVTKRADEYMAAGKYGNEYDDQKKSVFTEMFLFEIHRDNWEDIFNVLSADDIKKAEANFYKKCLAAAEDDLRSEAYADQYEQAFYHD